MVAILVATSFSAIIRNIENLVKRCRRVCHQISFFATKLKIRERPALRGVVTCSATRMVALLYPAKRKSGILDALLLRRRKSCLRRI